MLKYSEALSTLTSGNKSRFRLNPNLGQAKRIKQRNTK